MEINCRKNLVRRGDRQTGKFITAKSNDKILISLSPSNILNEKSHFFCWNLILWVFYVWKCVLQQVELDDNADWLIILPSQTLSLTVHLRIATRTFLKVNGYLNQRQAEALFPHISWVTKRQLQSRHRNLPVCQWPWFNFVQGLNIIGLTLVYWILLTPL